MKKCKLSEITLSIFDGKHGGCKSVNNSGYYFISVKDLEEYDINYSNAMQISKVDFDKIYSRTKLENGDTIYANSGDTIGKSIYVKDNDNCNFTSFQKSVAILKPNEAMVDSRFLYYLLKYYTPELRNASSGSAQKNLLLSTMRDFELNIPSLERQKYISSILGTIDDIIISNNKENHKIEKLLKEIYKKWFEDFEFPNDYNLPYKSSNGRMIYCEKLGLEIPEGWQALKLRDILTRNNKKITSNKAFDTIDLSVMPQNTIFTNKINTSEKFSTNLNIMNSGDILFGSIRPYLKKCIYAPCDGAVAGTVYSYKVEKVNSNFALMSLSNEKFFTYAMKVAKGTRMPVISNEDLLDYYVPYSKKIVEKYQNIVDLQELTSINFAENKKLELLRDKLLNIMMCNKMK